MDRFKKEKIKYVLNFKGTKKYMAENGKNRELGAAQTFDSKEEAKRFLATKFWGNRQIEINQYKVEKVKILEIREILN